MRKLALFLAAGAAALVVAGAAYAQAPQARPPLTRAAAEQRSDKLFARLDANHDGKIDQADHAVREKTRFDRVDANHDGQVSYAEFTAMHGRRDDARAERSPRGVNHMALRRAGAGRLIRLADADRDGAITQAEFHAAALTRFDQLDADKNGTVTPDEAKAARDSRRQQWQARREARAS
jgi:hypothetical protein